MKNTGVFFFGLICMVVLVTGCIGSQTSQKQPVEAAIPAITAATSIPTVTPSARPTVCTGQPPGVVECVYADVTKTAAPTISPKKTPTPFPTPEAFDVAGNPVVEETSSGPLASPVTLTGLGNQIVWFEAVHPGIVTFKMRNGFGSQYIKNCEEKYFRVMLAGKSIDSVLYDKGMALTGVTRTATVPLAGRYSLSVKSCGQWEIAIS